MSDDLPSRIAEVTEQRAKAQADLDWADQQWRALIAAAAGSGVSVASIADAAGISRARVYQIRDGRR